MTEKQVALMRVMKKEGKTLAAIGKKFKVSPQTISYHINKLTPAKKKMRAEFTLTPVAKGKFLPTKQSTPHKAKALIPATFKCPHCGGPIA